MFALFFLLLQAGPVSRKGFNFCSIFRKKGGCSYGSSRTDLRCFNFGGFFLYFVEILWLSGVSDISIDNYIFLALM